MSTLTVLHGVRTVQLTHGFNALIDEADYALVEGSRWCIFRTRGGAAKGRLFHYASRRATKACGSHHRFMHRAITDAPKGKHVDHRNGDGLDNRRENLRVCTFAENHRNIRVSWGVSKYKGVAYISKSGKWKATVMGADGRRRYLGPFRSEIEAAHAYDKVAIEQYGEFACTNAEMHGSL